MLAADSNIPISKAAQEELARILSRLFGPVLEAADLASEKIRLYRFKSALRTLKLAEVLAVQSGIDLKEPPIKFLVPFLEQCSLEDENSELTELWANLLVSAGSGYDARHPAFINILSQIGPEEALLLKGIWEMSHEKGFDRLGEFLRLYESGRASGGYGGRAAVSLDDAMNSGFLILAGSLPLGVGKGVKEISDGGIRSLLVLERQNLVKIRVAQGPHVATKEDVFAVTVHLTPLGYDFVRACKSGDVGEK